MPEPARSSAVVCGIGASLPTHTVSNEDLATQLDTSDTWIRQRTGISHRRIARTGLGTADLATQAAARALQSAGRRHVDAVILATATPDDLLPATAPAVASRLGLHEACAFDVAAVCTGFVYALATATGLITAGTAHSALVIGADRLSHLCASDDRTTRPLFGDGAGALVLRRGTPGEAGSTGPFILGSDGEHAGLLRAPHGGHLHMRGPELFRHAITRMSTAAQAAARAAGWRLQDIDHLVPHQANARITSAVSDRLNIPPHARMSNIADRGNTSAASIPLLLSEAFDGGRLKAGHRLLICAFGAGLTWGATTLTWPTLSAQPERSRPCTTT